ncbi:hypothetical protein [Marinimicrobium agarilyticum]|uniref:hypothetical protein n=1 Tax=Marinimicrobium agarilyticum TaxID=306546 RepID=UPI00041E788D|nr:hypothetical protein [Marinimicrobium agarilyticum]
MTELYILRNQQGYFLGKQKDWLDGRDRGALYKTPHKDEAINLKVEVSAKDFEQRIRILPCQADERGLPVLAVDDMPTPRAKVKPVPAEEADPASETSPEPSESASSAED